MILHEKIRKNVLRLERESEPNVIYGPVALAQELGVTKETIRRWNNTGGITGISLPGQRGHVFIIGNVIEELKEKF
jgi:hypothetical protein